MNIILKSLHIENFKGIKAQDITFTGNSKISGRNGSGKTTIVDAVLWLLFGKNSDYATDFGARPVDADGNTIHYVDIVVKAVIDIDGVEHELSKTQKENWVKPRGSEESVFKGNVNTFEIDGYPRTEKEYKEFVSGLTDEELFKILTSPTYFPALAWKKQREILMLFANEEGDVELAKRIGGFEELLDELSKAPSTTDILNKYKKAKKELETKLVELPIRIDEISKSKVDYDVAELEIQKKALEEKLASIDTKSNLLDGFRKDLMETEFAMSRIATEANDKNRFEKRELESNMRNENFYIREIDERASQRKKDVEFIEQQIARKNADIENLRVKFESVKKSVFPESEWVFDENATICKLCGQKLPADKIVEIKTDFEKRKANAKVSFEADKKQALTKINADAAAIKSDIAEISKRKDTLTEQIATDLLEKKQHSENYSVLSNKIMGIPETVNLLENAEYKKLSEKKQDLEAAISKNEEIERNNLLEKTSVNSELAIVTGKLNEFVNNDKIDARIDELKAEQLETSQKVATCEKFIYLTEQFIRAKLDAITTTVNSKFEGVTFSLFNQLINGGFEEECTCCVNGVKYSDLNNGHKIIAGLSIIKALSNYYKKHCFIFVDNAESINDSNFIDTDSQIIKLYVTEDKELKIE